MEKVPAGVGREPLMQVVLRPGETIEKTFGVGPRLLIFLALVAIGLLVGIPFVVFLIVPILGFETSGQIRLIAILVGVVAAAAMLVYTWYLAISRVYTITSQRVIQTVGWLSKVTVFADFQDITDVMINQDIFQRFILNIGTLRINTAGGSTQEINFDALEAPYETAALITTLSGRHLTRTNLNRARQGAAENPPDVNQGTAV